MESLFHLVCDNLMYYHYYFSLKYRGKVLFFSAYNVIWIEIFQSLVLLFACIIFMLNRLYFHYHHWGPIVVMAMVVIMIVTQIIIHLLKRREFCERLYAIYISMDEDTQKRMMKRGVYYNVVPFMTIVVGCFLMLYILQ